MPIDRLLPPGYVVSHGETPLANGSLLFQVQGTSIPANIWKDPLGTIPAPNPVQLNSGGQLTSEVWGDISNKMQVRDAGGSIVETYLQIANGLTGADGNGDTFLNGVILGSDERREFLFAGGSVQVSGPDASRATISILRHSVDGGGARVMLIATHSADEKEEGRVEIGRILGQLMFAGSDNSVAAGGEGIQFPRTYVQARVVDFVPGLEDPTVDVIDADLEFVAGGFRRLILQPDGTLRPAQNAENNLGTPDFRWNNSYFATSPTVVSDEREKQDIRMLSAAELEAWAKVNWKVYRFIEAFNEKGDAARIHAGPIAQEVELAFSSTIDPDTGEPLNAYRYGLIGKDLLFREIETTAQNGDIQVIRQPLTDPETGEQIERLNLRLNECQSFEAAYWREQFTLLDARVTALEP